MIALIDWLRRALRALRQRRALRENRAAIDRAKAEARKRDDWSGRE